MAQFYHPELGGGGQWMRGGMTMVGDMFNHGLQATVSGLCSELSIPARQPPDVRAAPPELGLGLHGVGQRLVAVRPREPELSGGQNDARYAYFPGPRRLAISRNGQITVYDTLNHNIGGVQQQQGGYSGSLSFSSQFGTFTVDSLPVVSGQGAQPAWQAPQSSQSSQSSQPEPLAYQPAPQQASQPQPSGGATQSHDEILSALERLGALHQKGVLSDQEFASKKAELLARL